MIDEYRAKLAQLAPLHLRHRKIDSMLQSIKEEKEDIAQRMLLLEAALQKEEADVAKFERLTLTSLLSRFLGKQDARLAKEEQEALAARLKYEAAVRQLDDCEQRRLALEREKEELAPDVDRYEEVFEQLRVLLREDAAAGEALCTLERQYEQTTGLLRELAEAAEAGHEAIRRIAPIESSLRSAESWGNWDLVGGGLLADFSKHSYLDDAQSGVKLLQASLSRFRSELADISFDGNITPVNVDGTLRFTDYFFDDFFSDLAVLSRIQNARERVFLLRRQISDTLEQLAVAEEAARTAKAVLEEKIDVLIVKG